MTNLSVSPEKGPGSGGTPLPGVGRRGPSLTFHYTTRGAVEGPIYKLLLPPPSIEGYEGQSSFGERCRRGTPMKTWFDEKTSDQGQTSKPRV